MFLFVFLHLLLASGLSGITDENVILNMFYTNFEVTTTCTLIIKESGKIVQNL